jgi:sugar lactone lactonase YvrE
MTKKNALAGFLGMVGLLALYLFFWPVPVDPAAWSPPVAPKLEGVFAPNSQLSAVERLGEGVCLAPEDMAFDAQRRIYTGCQDGRIVRMSPSGGRPEVFVDTNGRPLGLAFDALGNLLVADAYKGLLSVNPAGAVTVLSTQAGGVPFKLTDGMDIASDGQVYFSDASSKFSLNRYRLDLLEHRPNGRLLVYNPKTNETRILLSGLYFANGVAISPDGAFVLVVETGKYRVRRLWLKGPKQGTSEVFIENLPGLPDGISSNGRGVFWLALATPRDRKLDQMLPRPFLRKVIARLPQAFLPGPKDYGFVLGLDTAGLVVQNLQDPSGGYAQVTSVREYQGMLYLGSLSEDAIGRLPAPSY